MAAASHSHQWPRHALRLVGAGLGAVTCGPLGVALGGMVGGAVGSIFGDQVREIAEKIAHHLVESGGEKLSELSVHFLHEQIHEMRPHPELEAVMREALRSALAQVHSRLSPADAPRYKDWFANWDRSLRVPFEAPPDWIEGTKALEAGDAGVDSLFRSTMERLDGQARAAKSGGLPITATNHFRSMPDDLLSLLLERLPGPLDSHFNESLTHPENDAAWKAVVLPCLRRIESKLDKVLDVVVQIPKFYEEQIRRAEERGRIAEEEARTLRAEKQEWVGKYVKLLEDVSGHGGEPGEASLEKLLEAGDLNGAVRLKTEQIEKRTGEVQRLARDWAELGRVHDLRFDWAEALRCYREAWRLDRDEWEYGFPLAYFAQKQNRFEEAIETYSQVLERLRDDEKRAAVLNNLAILYHATQRVQDAEEALSIRRSLAEANPQAYLPVVAMTLNNLAVLYSDTQRMQDAESAYQAALSTYRSLTKANPQAYLPDVAMTLNNLAILYSDTQRIQDAESAFHEALSTNRSLAKANPQAYLPDVAMTLNNLAILYRATQRMQDAESAYQEALSIRRSLAEANPQAYLPDVAMTLNNLAVLYRATQRMQDAEGAYQEALSIRRSLAAANPQAYLPYVATTLNNLAVLYGATQRMPDAESAYQEALSTYRSLAEANPQAYLPDVAMTLNNLAVLYGATQRMPDAESAFQEALSIRRSLAKANPQAYLPNVALTLNNLANLYFDTQRMQDAETHSAEARTILEPLWEKSPALHGDRMARIYWNSALCAGQRATEACAFARKMLACSYEPGLKQAAQELIERFCE